MSRHAATAIIEAKTRTCRLVSFVMVINPSLSALDLVIALEPYAIGSLHQVALRITGKPLRVPIEEDMIPAALVRIGRFAAHGRTETVRTVIQNTGHSIRNFDGF